MEKGDQKIVIYWSWKKTLMIIAAVLLVPTLFIWIFSFTLKTTVISPNFYKGVLKKADTYNRLVNEGIPSLVLSSTVSKDATTDVVAKELIVFVVQKTIDPLWVQAATNKLIDEIVVFLRVGNKAGNKVEVDLASADQFLNKTNAWLGLASQMIPSCTGGETKTAATICKNADINPDQIRQSIATVQNDIGNLKLGTINIENDVTKVNSVVSFIQKFVRNINLYFWFSLVIGLLLIAAIVLLSFEDLRFMSGLIAIPMAIAAIFSLVVVLLLNPLSNVGTNLSLDLPTEMKSIIADALHYNTLGILHRLEIISVIVLALAVVVYFIDWILKSLRHRRT